MNRHTAQGLLLFSILALNVSCGGDDSAGHETAGSSGLGGVLSGGRVGVAGAPSGGGGTAGTPSGGAGTGISGAGVTGGSGGSGGATALTPEQLLTATYAECSKGCSLVHTACPTTNASSCTEGCNSQADGYFDSGKCGVEFYEVWSCINRTLSPTDITCAASIGGRPMFNGCSSEQVRYTTCQ